MERWPGLHSFQTWALALGGSEEPVSIMHLLGKDGRGPCGHFLQPLVDTCFGGLELEVSV